MVEQVPNNPSLYRAVIRWLKVAIGSHPGLELTIDEQANLAEAKIMLKDRMDQWQEEFRQEGREEGLKEGREEGRKIAREGMARMLLDGLELKFSDIPESLKQQVLQATDKQIEQWFRKFVLANQLDDVFK